MTLLTPLVAALLVTASSPIARTAAADVSAYPELAPANLLPAILTELKQTLKDPSSVRDFVLCPADKVNFKDGKPVRWSVLLSFNAKNGFGGYEGAKMYAAVFRNGQLSGKIVATQFPNSDGFVGLVNDMVARKMANCPAVSDQALQRSLVPGASIYKEPVP